MTHLDEGTLQAYLDDELPGRERAVAAEHILVCGECRTALEELKQASTVFRRAIAEIDVQAPAATPPRAAGAGSAPGFGGRHLARAAVLVLLLAAAASAAAVPGSPIREWIVAAVSTPEPDPERVTPPVVAPPTEPAPAAPAGISVPVDGRIEVAITDLRDAAIRLVRADKESLSVSALGGDRDPVFRTEAGRVEVAGGVGGQVVVELPVGVMARIIVDGRIYAEQADGRLRVLVPGEDVEGGVVWR